MFKIEFDPALGKFYIAIATCGGLMWSRVLNGGQRGEEGLLTFDTFEDADAHVRKIGLSTLYQDKSAHQYRRHMAIA